MKVFSDSIRTSIEITCSKVPMRPETVPSEFITEAFPSSIGQEQTEVFLLLMYLMNPNKNFTFVFVDRKHLLHR